jgi:hypothetical protein
MSGTPGVAFYPPSLGSGGGGGRIVALTWCSQELSTCCTVVTPRMLFTCQHTVPPSLAGVGGKTFRRAATVAMFWEAMVKAGSCCPPRLLLHGPTYLQR